MPSPITGQRQQLIDNKPVEPFCLYVPFIAIGRCIQRCLRCIADFFGNLCSSSRPLVPERLTMTAPSLPGPIRPLASHARCPSRDLIRFYRGEKNDRNITLSFLIKEADNDFLERGHLWVQWAFPLREPSGPNPTAPILDEETIKCFQNDAELQAKLLDMFKRMLNFLGLTLQENTGAVVKSADFDQRSIPWNQSTNHNHLRITRILKCLQLLQAPSERSWSIALLVCLKNIQGKYHRISPENFSYFRAVHPTI